MKKSELTLFIYYISVYLENGFFTMDIYIVGTCLWLKYLPITPVNVNVHICIDLINDWNKHLGFKLFLFFSPLNNPLNIAVSLKSPDKI